MSSRRVCGQHPCCPPAPTNVHVPPQFSVPPCPPPRSTPITCPSTSSCAVKLSTPPTPPAAPTPRILPRSPPSSHARHSNDVPPCRSNAHGVSTQSHSYDVHHSNLARTRPAYDVYDSCPPPPPPLPPIHPHRQNTDTAPPFLCSPLPCALPCTLTLRPLCH